MSAGTTVKLHEVEQLREARLQAQAYAFQLDKAHNELEHLRHHVTALEQQLQGVAPQLAACAGGTCCAAGEALQEARLQAADDRCKLQLTELELAKQIDALQELQWQLECVVAQLGLAQPQVGARPEESAQLQQSSGAATQGMTPAGGSGIDPMLLLGKVEELKQAQMQLGEHKRLLAFAEAQLRSRQQAGAGSWQPQEPARCTPGVAVPAGLDPERSELCSGDGGSGRGGAAGGAADVSGRGEPLGPGGRQLVGELLNENEVLRQRLAEAEESYRSLERDYEVELLMKAEAQESAEELAATPRSLPPRSPAVQQQSGGGSMQRSFAHVQVQVQRRMHAGRLGVNPQAALPDADDGTENAAVRTRRGGQPVSESMELIARQRLGFRLQEKDKQLAKMRVVVRDLELKQIEAHKRQADMAMKESSWREQEAQDRRIAQLDEKARLEFAAAAAQAEADAARKEATAQRRLVKRLQEQAAAAAAAADGAGGSGGGRSSQMAELLQKRVKVLEAQNIRLRLQAKSSKEEEELAAAEAAAAAARAARAQRRGGAGSGSSGGGEQQNAAAGEGSQDGGPAAENDSPNRTGEVAAEGSSLLHIPFARWEADKRLQKRVETLQGRLRDKTAALVSADVARRKAEEQAAAAQAAAQQAQGALAAAQAQLRQAEQRSVPGTMVVVGQYRELLLEVEQAQQQYDELERRYAALLHRVPAGGSIQQDVDGSNSGSATAGGGSSHAEGQSPGRSSQPGLDPSAAAQGTTTGSELCSTLSGTVAGLAGLPPGRSLSALRTSGSGRMYRPGDYGGTGSVCKEAPSRVGVASAKDDLAAQLLEKDAALFDAGLQREQAAADADRHRRRLHSLLDALSPHPHDTQAAAAIAEARQLAGLPPLAGIIGSAVGAASVQTAAVCGRASRAAGAAGTAAAGSGKQRKPSVREQELLDTVALLKAALERTKKGLESGVSNAKYMAAVDKAKQLKAQCQSLEAQLEDAARARDELARVQQQLGALHGTCSALRSQLKAAKEQREEAAAAREHILSAQVSELERTLRERDAQMEALNTSTQQVDEEVRVLVAEGLRPCDLIQEMLVLRPRVRELESQNAVLSGELGGLEEELARDMAGLQADHELLRRQCQRWEGEIRGLCARHGEPLPLGLV